MNTYKSDINQYKKEYNYRIQNIAVNYWVFLVFFFLISYIKACSIMLKISILYMYDIVVSSFVKRSPGPWFGKPYLMISSSMTVKVSGFYLAAKSDYW